MRMPSKIAVEVEEDRMGNIIARPVNARYAKAFAKARKENGGGGGEDAFFNDGGEAEEFKREHLNSRQRKEIEKGYPVRMKVDPWVVGHWYGYDAHTVAENTESVLRQRGYLSEGYPKGYDIPIKIGYDTLNIFQRYWEGQGDPLYALLSRRGNSVDIVTVKVSKEELERLIDQAKEILRKGDKIEKRVAKATLGRLKKAGHKIR